MANRGKLARDFYVQLGYSPVQAAGIVGNLMQESGPGLDTGAVGDKGTAFGIAQWRGSRQKNLKAFAAEQGKDASDFETQLRFVDYELRNHETDAFERLQSATTVPEATAAMISYERPKGWTAAAPQEGHGWAARLSNAMALVGGSDGSGKVNTTIAHADTGPMLNQVLAGKEPKKSTVLSRLAQIDFASLFQPPPMPELPKLPPVPDPIPIDPAPLYRPPEFASRSPWSAGLPGLSLAARRRV